MASARRKHRESFGRLDRQRSGRIRARYLGPDGELHAAPQTFDTLTDARAWLAARQVEIATGQWQSPAAVAAARAAAATTLGDYAETWLSTNRNRKGEPLRPRTVAEYQRLIAGPLAELAALPLAAITAETVDSWYDAQSRTGRLTQTSRAYSLLATILAHAVDRGRIPLSPCRVRGGQAARTGKKVTPPTDAELATILDVIPDHYRALVHLAAEGGLRWGEATELRRRDVKVERDDDGGVLRVRISVSRGVTRVRGEMVVGAPKTAAGVRSVFVYGAAAESIAAHLARYVPRFGDPLLFTAPGDDTGTRHLPQPTFHGVWARARHAAGRDDLPFHALRHYAGTRFAQHGATLAETMARLGHASPAVAMRYQHATDRDAEIAARMAQRVTPL